MSALRALRGETYSTRSSSPRWPSKLARVRSSMAERNAHRVLPEPVGAATRVWRPSLMWGQAAAWGAVGAP